MLTQTVTITQNSTPNIIIGRRSTYETQQVIFDVSWLVQTYGEGTAELLIKRPKDASAYPVVAVLDGNTLTWTVGDTDTQDKGHGECEIYWYVNGGLAKSCICGITILRDIGDTTETAPDPYETWIETLSRLGAETLTNAQAAQQSANSAAQSASEAENSAAAALESEENALDSENAAKASEQAAAASAQGAEQSATAARQSAAEADQSATNAHDDATDASASADRAEQAAASIEGDTERAEAAARTAQGAASDASGFAGTASTKATEASQSAATAEQAARTATQESADASAAATAAVDSASSASASATAAGNAQSAAETAQGKAEDAQEAAETAAQSIEDSAAQIDQNAEDILNLKSALSDVTTEVKSNNIFNQSAYSITEGKYLNYTNGNEGSNESYCYVNDYIPVEANTMYCATTWLKTNKGYAGPYNAYTLFYDSSKQFISGLSGNVHVPFTTPEGCAFIRVSHSLNIWNNYYLMIEKGETASRSYNPYFDYRKLRFPFITVSKDGSGDYDNISDAVASVNAGAVIIVGSGTYEEDVGAWGKEIHLIGVSREACIIKDTSGNYSTPPLEIGAGSVQNMTIIEEANGAGTENMGAYAIHVEDNNLYNKKLLIRNCYIYSDSSSAIGMGLRGGCSARIEGCEIICAGERTSTGAAPLYFHDADAQAYWGTANLYLHGNVLRNTASTLFSMLTINSIHKENTTYMHMMYNIFVRSKTPALSQKFNTWNTSGNTDADGWNGLSHMYLEDDSFGNNLTKLNYSA